ncbi:MAG: adenylyl cyclase, partial [Pseudomonadota bacterium]
MSFITDLRRRNVFRVGLAYAVVCWLLLQISDILIERIGAPDWVFPTLLMVLGIGFPLALLFAWAFEMTPEGLKRESEVDRSTSITPQTGRRLDRAIIVVLGLALAYFALDKFVLGPEAPVTTAQTEREATSQRDTDEAPTAVSSAEGTTTDRGPSIAVLPFVNMSAEADNEYFSDGLSEELLNLLARIEGLSVAARTSSFKFKGSDADIAEIGGRLNVGMVLEGSVRKAGDQVRITAQLIKVDDGFHLWSDTYDRQLDN